MKCEDFEFEEFAVAAVQLLGEVVTEKSIALSRKGTFAFNILLPQYVVHPERAGPEGVSKLTLAGIQ